jgi:hypothetical protein
MARCNRRLADESAVAYHTSAFPLVTRALEVPTGATFGQPVTYNGFALRLIRDYELGFQQDREPHPAVGLPVFLVLPAAGFGVVAVGSGPHRLLVLQPGADRSTDGGHRADEPAEFQVVGDIDRPLQGLFQY